MCVCLPRHRCCYSSQCWQQATAQILVLLEGHTNSSSSYSQRICFISSFISSLVRVFKAHPLTGSLFLYMDVCVQVKCAPFLSVLYIHHTPFNYNCIKDFRLICSSHQITFSLFGMGNERKRKKKTNGCNGGGKEKRQSTLYNPHCCNRAH